MINTFDEREAEFLKELRTLKEKYQVELDDSCVWDAYQPTVEEQLEDLTDKYQSLEKTYWEVFQQANQWRDKYNELYPEYLLYRSMCERQAVKDLAQMKGES